jgi:hypothetical protein
MRLAASERERDPALTEVLPSFPGSGHATGLLADFRAAVEISSDPRLDRPVAECASRLE